MSHDLREVLSLFNSNRCQFYRLDSFLGHQLFGQHLEQSSLRLCKVFGRLSILFGVVIFRIADNLTEPVLT
jgi:hypothetical protein